MIVTITLQCRTFTAAGTALIVENGTRSLLGSRISRPFVPGEEADVTALHLGSRTSSRPSTPSITRPLDEHDLMSLTNTELDDIFRASPPGQLPAGVVRGTALVFTGTLACRIIAKLAYWFAWQGKKLDPERDSLVNRITPLRLPLIRATVSHGGSWVDGEECTVIDYSKTSLVARMVRDETRLVAPELHLGVVWLWRKRAAWFTLRAPRP
jgi:hypothetical protein